VDHTYNIAETSLRLLILASESALKLLLMQLSLLLGLHRRTG
jgi:hypothetical protein